MKPSIFIPLTICLALIAGCKDEETFSRYPSVGVPNYGVEDYIRDLSDPNPERVYNAICILGQDADDFGKTLCAEDANPASPEYQNSENAYRMVCGKIESENPMIAAASLRFLQIFAKKYEAKDELLEIVCKVDSRHPQVQFEQVTLIKRLVCEDSPDLPEPLLRRLMDSPSWIVSRTAYGLVSLSGGALRKELVRRYLEASDEKERLILIMAMHNQLEQEEAQLLEEEVLSTESPKIRRSAIGALVQNVHCPGVRPWFTDHYQQFTNEEKAWLFDKCDDDDLSLWFLSQGFVPDDKLLKDLAKASFLADDELRNELLRFEKAIQANPQLAEHWNTLKDEAAQERQRQEALREDMTPLCEEFLENTKAMLAKHGKSADEQESRLEKIGKTLKPYMKD